MLQKVRKVGWLLIECQIKILMSRPKVMGSHGRVFSMRMTQLDWTLGKLKWQDYKQIERKEYWRPGGRPGCYYCNI